MAVHRRRRGGYPPGLREGGNDASRSTGRSGRQNAATRRNMRREDWGTFQGPVEGQQPHGMAHGGSSPPAVNGTGNSPSPGQPTPGGVKQGGWRVPDGIWRVTDGGWTVTHSGWVTDGRYLWKAFGKMPSRAVLNKIKGKGERGLKDKSSGGSVDTTKTCSDPQGAYRALCTRCARAVRALCENAPTEGQSEQWREANRRRQRQTT